MNAAAASRHWTDALTTDAAGPSQLRESRGSAMVGARSARAVSVGVGRARTSVDTARGYELSASSSPIHTGTSLDGQLADWRRLGYRSADQRAICRCIRSGAAHSGQALSSDYSPKATTPEGHYGQADCCRGFWGSSAACSASCRRFWRSSSMRSTRSKPSSADGWSSAPSCCSRPMTAFILVGSGRAEGVSVGLGSLWSLSPSPESSEGRWP